VRCLQPTLVALMMITSANAQTSIVHSTRSEFGEPIPQSAVDLVLERQAAGLYERPLGRRGTHTVPVIFHIVRDSLGRVTHPSGRDLDERVPEAMRRVNEHYSLSGMQFCQAGAWRYIDDDFWANWEPGATMEELLQIGRVEGAVNIYLYPRPLWLGGVITYTWSPVQSIGINFNVFNAGSDNSSLTRMISYYFDVFQTDETMFGVECASGSNCKTAGDLVCDTPTDDSEPANIRTCEWLFPPPYPGPCPGDPTYTPDKNNIMSGRGPFCHKHLTQGQQDRAYATLVNIRHEITLSMCACPADCDLNGKLDINDYFCFLDAFGEREPYACDMSTTGARVCDIFDFLAFQDLFVTGCP